MSKLADLRHDLLSDEVHRLAEALRRRCAMARNLACIIHEAYGPVVEAPLAGSTVCGLCGLPYIQHPQILGDFVLCNGHVTKICS